VRSRNAAASPGSRAAFRVLQAVLLAGLALGAAPGQADSQRDPELRDLLVRAIAQSNCFADRFDSEVWFKMMDTKRLRHFVADPKERFHILEQAFCEANRKGEKRLPPGLVMAIIDVESQFNRYAVSTAGAVGLMQVMSFWPRRLGVQNKLVQVDENIRLGAVILRFYLDRERNDVARALQRYNGSLGRRTYSDAVIRRWTTYWNGADDMGLAPGQSVLKYGGG
jgi:soluble lytic murein transglycosylase-like protein